MIEPFEPRDIKILVGRRPDTYYIFMEIVDENILRATVFTNYWSSAHDFDTVFDTSVLENFVDKFGNVIGSSGEITNWVYDRGERVLSQRQLNNIWSLATSLVIGGIREGFEPVAQGQIVYVWGVVDNEMYWGLYFDDINDHTQEDGWERDYMNRELLNLLYYLVDLSPIQLNFDRVRW